jgi:hypothetical protein
MLINRPEWGRQVSGTGPACPGFGRGVTASSGPVPVFAEVKILIEQRIANEGPKTGLAYLL